MPKKVKKKTKSGRQASHDSRNNAGASKSCKEINVTYLDSPVKPDVDKAEYRTIKLPNGLTALLASLPANDSDEECESVNGSEMDASGDKKQEESCTFANDLNYEQSSEVGCSLAINVGCFSDPARVPAMTPLLNSVFPTWSKKYPLPRDNFENHILKGMRYSGGETSVIVFRVTKSSLLKTLDRFTQCYIMPIIKRDRLAIELEMRLFTISSQGKDYAHAIATLGTLRHPMRCFRKHYVDKLVDVTDDAIYRELLRYRERHYSAHRMNFYIRAELPLDELEEIVKTYFSAIPNNGIEPIDFSRYNFQNSFEPPKLLTAEQAPASTLELMWALPPSRWLYKCNPINYIARLLEYKGPGSLFSYWRKKNWCQFVSCSYGPANYNCGELMNDFWDNSMYSLFFLAVGLTDQGLKNRKLIIESIYSYIALMRREGPQQIIWEQIRDHKKTLFRFERYNGSIDTELRDVSVAMQNYAPSDYLSRNNTYEKYVPGFIEICTTILTPDRANIIFFERPNESLDDVVKTPIFEKLEKVPNDWLESFKNAKPLPEFHLPRTNANLSNDLTLISMPENSSLYPLKIHSDDSSEIWYKQDSNVRPNCYVYFSHGTFVSLMSAKNSAMRDLFVDALDYMIKCDYDSSVTYDVYMWLRRCDVRAVETGFEVRAECLNQTIPFLLQTITSAIKDCGVWLTEGLFDNLKERLILKYASSLVCPNKLLHNSAMSMQRIVYWAPKDRSQALSGCGYSDFTRFHEEFTSHGYFKCLVQGNVTQADGLKYARKCAESVNRKPSWTNVIREMKFKEISRGQHCCKIRVIANRNQPEEFFMRNHYFFYDTSIQLSVVCDLLQMIIGSPKFRKLREIFMPRLFEFQVETDSNKLLSYAIEKEPSEAIREPDADVDRRIEQFRKDIESLSERLTDEEWLVVKKVAVKIMREPCDGGEPELSASWHEITTGEYVFDRKIRKIRALSELKPDDIRKFLKILASNGPEIRKISFRFGRAKGKDKTGQV